MRVRCCAWRCSVARPRIAASLVGSPCSSAADAFASAASGLRISCASIARKRSFATFACWAASRTASASASRRRISAADLRIASRTSSTSAMSARGLSSRSAPSGSPSDCATAPSERTARATRPPSIVATRSASSAMAASAAAATSPVPASARSASAAGIDATSVQPLAGDVLYATVEGAPSRPDMRAAPSAAPRSAGNGGGAASRPTGAVGTARCGHVREHDAVAIDQVERRVRGRVGGQRARPRGRVEARIEHARPARRRAGPARRRTRRRRFGPVRRAHPRSPAHACRRPT